MNDLELFLNQKTNGIRKVVFCIGETFSSEELMSLLDHTRLETLILTGCLSQKAADERFAEALYRAGQKGKTLPFVEYRPLSELQIPEGEYALLFSDPADNSDILPLAEKAPAYLAGRLTRTGITAFALWEAFRKTCKHIRIVTALPDREPQVLDWERSPDTDVELSVIFPMYNVAKYLPQCIESVTAWKAEYIEFLFVNDGSPDNSREVVLEYAKNDPRIRLIDKENGGCASARQMGLEQAKGRYVGFIDPDDFIDESMYRKLLRAAMVGSYDISYCGYNEYYETTGQSSPCVIDTLGWPYNQGVHDVKRIQDLIPFARVAIWRGIYKMEMLRRNKIHFYTDIRRYDDLPFKVETFAAAQSVVTVEEHLYYYRLARPGQDVLADDDRLYIHFPIFAYLNQSVAEKKNRELTDKLQMCKIQTHRYCLEKIKPQFLSEYVRQAKKDLRSTGTAKRTFKVAKKMIGKKSALFAWAIMHGQSWLVRLLRKK